MILTMLWKWLRGLWSGGGEHAPVLEAPKAPVREPEFVNHSDDRNKSDIAIFGDAPTEPAARP